MVLYVANDDFFRNHGIAASFVFFILKFLQIEIEFTKCCSGMLLGLQNYIKRCLADETVRTSTMNTLFFAVVSVALEVIVGLFVAMALCSDKMWAKIATSIFLIPTIMAPVAIGTLWRMMLDSTTGIINYFLEFLWSPEYYMA